MRDINKNKHKITQQKRVTIKDVAVDTGFTAQAVSRALRNKDDISTETKQIIRDAAQRLGYIKNMTASSLRGGYTRSIAVIYDHIVNPYYSIMTNYLHGVFKKLSYTLVIFTSENRYLNADTFDMLVSRNIDGAISFLEPEPSIEELAERYKIPVMILGRNGCGSIDCILTDDKDGGTKAARQLINCGCKRILHITESFDITCAVERYEGFKLELEKENLFDPELLIILEGHTLDEKMEAFLKTGKTFDGIFAFNDMLALESLYSLEKARVDGIKIVGYDNIQADMRIPGQLTTIGSDKQQMAEVAAHVLISKIENSIQKSFKKIHEVFVVKGETT